MNEPFAQNWKSFQELFIQCKVIIATYCLLILHKTALLTQLEFCFVPIDFLENVKKQNKKTTQINL